MNKCKHCQQDTKNPNYCSRNCAAKETNKNPKRKRLARKCVYCSNPALYKSGFCEEHQEKTRTERSMDKIGDRTLSYYFSLPSLKDLHKSSKSVHIRLLAKSWNKELSNLPCAKCGYDKHVELCHIKAIKDFPDTATLKEVNCKENLIQLCPNCHWEMDHL